ncbi:MAG: ubiquinol-cytochrome c reductase iron-sulfur subunit [Candidatus Glassbacteria bacterium]
MREDTKAESQDILKRRDFLAKVLKTIGTVFFVACIYPLIRYLSPTAITGTGKEVEISLDDLPVGDSNVIDIAGQPVILIRTQKEVIALSAICTHLGCVVQFKKEENIIHCPCHAAAFDIKGNVLKGPATIPLKTYQTNISGNRVFIGGS